MSISRGTVASQLYVWDTNTLSWVAWGGGSGSSGSSGGDGAILDGVNATIKATVTGANALKVDGSAVAQPITDNSGSLTVDGTVTANIGTGNLAGITAVVHVDDNSGSLTVDGPLTDTQLRASNVGVAGLVASAPADAVSANYFLNTAASSAVGAVAGYVYNGTNWDRLRGDTTNGAFVNVKTSALPTGAATAAKQPALGTAGSASADVLSVQGVASMTALKVDGSAVTQPVSGTVTANIGTSGSLALDATLTGGTQKTKIIDTAGTNVASVSAAGAVKVDGSAVTQPVSGTVSITANSAVNVAQVNAGTAVASVTGVLDVMPRKRTGSTGLSPTYSASHITTSATTTLISATAYIQCIVIACTTAGTTWTLKLQNKEATPKVLIPAITMAVPTAGPIVFQFAEPILMTSGIDIITAGTAGVVDVFVTYWS